MSGRNRAYISGVGMITPIGSDAAMTLASVRAGISGHRESNILNKAFNPVVMATVPDEALPPLHPELEENPAIGVRQKRMLRLIGAALSEVFASYPGGESLPLFLAGPESTPGCVSGIAGAFLEQVVVQSEACLDLSASRLIATGRAAGVQAVDMALRYFESTDGRYALVGGVDTYMDPKLIGYLDRDDRIKAEHVVDGFVPGEGACVLLLSAPTGGDSLSGGNGVAEVSEPALAEEEGHIYSDAPYTGEGLATAVSAAVSGTPPGAIAGVFSSLNGESFGSKEYGVAVARNASVFKDDFELHHPADCFGDLGAAAGPVLIALAASSGPHINLVCCSSDTGSRGAVCITGGHTR